MTSITNGAAGLAAREALMMGILRREGAQTLESLTQRSGLEWSEVFLAIDALSRSGKVWLGRGAGRDYRVSIYGEKA